MHGAELWYSYGNGQLQASPSRFCLTDFALGKIDWVNKAYSRMNQAYSRLSTTHGHITDCKL